MQAYGVSRTVVREALSKLQAGGLVETHHGIGTFVLQPRAAGMFRLDASEHRDLGRRDRGARVAHQPGDRIGRPGRRSAAPRSNLAACAQRSTNSSATWAAAGDTVAPDFRFHLTIAQATRQPATSPTS